MEPGSAEWERFWLGWLGRQYELYLRPTHPHLPAFLISPDPKTRAIALESLSQLGLTLVQREFSLRSAMLHDPDLAVQDFARRLLDPMREARAQRRDGGSRHP